MDWQIILGFFLLLLPVPLSFFIPANPNARPDPHHVRLARYAAVLFPAFVAAIQLMSMIYLKSLYSDSQQDYVPDSSSLFIWAPMAWFFFGNLIFLLRKPASKPFSETTGRAATLTPRQKHSPIPYRAWYSLAGIWAMVILLITLRVDPVPTISWIFLASAALMLMIGPWLERQNLLSAEPMLPSAQASILEAYSRRRHTRSWCLFTIIAISATWKTLLAALYAFEHPILTTRFVFPVTTGLILLVLAILLILEFRAWRRISRLLCQVPAVDQP